MSTWLTIPSARPKAEAERVLRLWRQQGYRVALWRDSPDDAPMCDLLLVGEYPGYAMAVNALSAVVMECGISCKWIVAGGDDTEPDMNHTADEIARQCSEHFSGTFGVMQPTGDRFCNGSIDRIAGSPWLGIEWCKRANGGQGPFWPDFRHMFGDECLQRAAQKLGVFWQRPDLIHLHHHFMRKTSDVTSAAVHAPIPEHLREWNSPAHWEEMKAIFKRLESQDFAPCMPLPVEVLA